MYSSPDICIVDLQSHVQKLQADFHCLDDQSQVQTSLDHFWSRLSWYLHAFVINVFTTIIKTIFCPVLLKNNGDEGDGNIFPFKG